MDWSTCVGRGDPYRNGRRVRCPVCGIEGKAGYIRFRYCLSCEYVVHEACGFYDSNGHWDTAKHWGWCDVCQYGDD